MKLLSLSSLSPLGSDYVFFSENPSKQKSLLLETIKQHCEIGPSEPVTVYTRGVSPIIFFSFSFFFNVVVFEVNILEHQCFFLLLANLNTQFSNPCSQSRYLDAFHKCKFKEILFK